MRIIDTCKELGISRVIRKYPGLYIISTDYEATGKSPAVHNLLIQLFGRTVLFRDTF